MDKTSKIFVAGHAGLVGSALVRQLRLEGYSNLVTRSSSELNLLNQTQVADFLGREKPEYVFMATGKVGGIKANSSYPASFIFENLEIQNNLIHQSHLNGVKGLLYLASACIYPKHASQPMTEDVLMTSPVESTNEYYSIAKIAGLKMCEAYNRQYGTRFKTLVGANLYGINDNFHPEDSHVIPALMQRIHQAKIGGLAEVVIWGTGSPQREFLYVDDFAKACLYVMSSEFQQDFLNVGSGNTVSIKELAYTIRDVIQFKGDLIFDSSKPDGMPIKILDSSKISEMAWKASTSLPDGLAEVYKWFCNKTVLRTK